MVEHYQLAKLCERTSKISNGKIPASADYSTYGFYLFSTMASETGLFAASYQNQKTSDAVIVFKGTDDINADNFDFDNFLADIQNNLQIIIKESPAQLDDSVQFARGEINKLPGYSFTICGHSLGGFLAQAAGIELGINIVAFDSPGAKNFLLGTFDNFDSRLVTIYNSQPNFINTMHAPINKPILVSFKTEIDDDGITDFIKFSLDQHKISNIASAMEKGSITHYQGKWPSNAVSAYLIFSRNYNNEEQDIMESIIDIAGRILEEVA